MNGVGSQAFKLGFALGAMKQARDMLREGRAHDAVLFLEAAITVVDAPSRDAFADAIVTASKLEGRHG